MTLGCISYVASLRQTRRSCRLQDQTQRYYGIVDVAIASAASRVAF